MPFETTQVVSEKNRRIISRQFSLSMLMLIVTGIGCYLGGRIQGYRQGLAIWDSAPRVTVVFAIDSFLLDPKPGTKEIQTLDGFTLQLKNDVMPGVWSESGGKAYAVPSKNSTIVVTANQLVLEAVSEYLRKAKAGGSP